MYFILRVVKYSVGQSRNSLPGGSQGMDGSFEGYFTVNEMSKFLVETASELSPLAKGPLVIGKSRKNVDILALCVGQCHKCAPLTLYTGLHHGREPMSMMSLAYTLRYIRDSVASKSIEMKALLEARQLWFIPMVNPDGYSRNVLEKDPNKRIYRKNREGSCVLNTDETGVDLNRNYDFCFEGGNAKDCMGRGAHCGSSNDPCKETYRGKFAFSEPETVAVRNFVLTHNVTAALNYHSYGSNLFWPYSCTTHARKLEWANNIDTIHYVGKELSKLSGYSPGNVIETLNYNAAGDASDWMYGEMGIVALTPETGPSDLEAFSQNKYSLSKDAYGFFPPSNVIPSLAKASTLANIRLAWMSGELYELKVAASVVSVISNETLPRKSKSYAIKFVLKNAGIQGNRGDIAIGLTAEDGSGSSHKLLRVSSTPRRLERNDTWLVEMQFDTKSLLVAGVDEGIDTLHAVVSDGFVCTLFTLSRKWDTVPMQVVKTTQLRFCDMCIQFYPEIVKTSKNGPAPTGSTNQSLHSKRLIPISELPVCPLNYNHIQLTKCSGRGIPDRFDWSFVVGLSLTIVALASFAIVIWYFFFSQHQKTKYSQRFQILGKPRLPRLPAFTDDDGDDELEGVEIEVVHRND
jgi:hypothetical protein